MSHPLTHTRPLLGLLDMLPVEQAQLLLSRQPEMLQKVSVNAWFRCVDTVRRHLQAGRSLITVDIRLIAAEEWFEEVFPLVSSVGAPTQLEGLDTQTGLPTTISLFFESNTSPRDIGMRAGEPCAVWIARVLGLTFTPGRCCSTPTQPSVSIVYCESLLEAVEQRHQACWTQLLNERSTRWWDITAALMLAAELNELAFVNAALQADFTDIDHVGLSRAVVVATAKNHIEVVRALLNAGASADSEVDRNKRTAAHLAAAGGFVECLHLLLEHAADVSKVDHPKWSPLHLAANNGHVECVRMLLMKGSPIDAQTDRKQTAAHLAARNGHFGCLTALLVRQADVFVVDRDQRTAAHLAAAGGFVNCLESLFDRDAEAVKVVDHRGWSPLHFAADRGHADCLEPLLTIGLPIDARNNGERTAAHLAACKGRHDCLKVLLDHEADVLAVDNNGWSVAECAKRHFHDGCSALLSEWSQSHSDAQSRES